MATGCECTEPGWCERHGVEKNANWFHQCQTRQVIFNLWERGLGPGQEIVATAGEAPVKDGSASKALVTPCERRRQRRAERKEYFDANAEFIASLCEGCDFAGCQDTPCRRQGHCPRHLW